MVVGAAEDEAAVLMRVLVTGAAGQLGHDVVATCEAKWDRVVARAHADLDITDRSAVLGVVASERPDVVVNCAAWTAVDACESDPELAFRRNAMAVRFLVEACDRAGAHLVHVSSDYVFDGTKPDAYHEWDVTNPTSIYGASKRAGELEALAAGAGACVVRTSWVCGEYGNNMVTTILRLAGDHDTLRFVDDQIGHPSFTADLAPMIRRIALDRVSGVVHLTNQGPVSWCGFAKAVLAAAGLDPDRVSPITTAELQPARPARRPANSRLDNQALRFAGYDALDDFRRPLGELVGRLLA